MIMQQKKSPELTYQASGDLLKYKKILSNRVASQQPYLKIPHPMVGFFIPINILHPKTETISMIQA